MSSNHDEEMMMKELLEFKNQPLPDVLDQQIHQGFERGRRHKRRWEVVKHSGLSVAALFLLFVLSVNYIPGFSQMAGDIPWMKNIVKLVNDDQGLHNAIENKYVQIINKSDTKDGITFTIDNIIIDKQRLILFTSVETTEEYEEIGFNSIKLKDNKEEILQNYSLNYGRVAIKDKKGSARLDFAWNEDQEFTDAMTIQIELVEYNYDETTTGETIVLTKPLTVTFPVDLEKILLSEEYTIDQTQFIDDQQIHFEKLVSFPTRHVLYLKYNEENSKEILGLVDLHLENEKGEIISRESGSSIDGNHRTISLTGSYFQDNEELYVVLSKAMALDKEKSFVTVSLENNKLLHAPDDQLTLRGVSTTNMLDLENTLAVNFATTSTDASLNEFSLSGAFTDGTGKKFHSNSQSSSASEYTIYIKNREYKSPLTFSVERYPLYIEEEIRIRVK